MQFALALPAWIIALVVIGLAAIAWVTYAGAIVPLSRGRRAVLVTVRALALLLLFAVVLRPVRVMPATEAAEAVIAILVDTSRSMRVPDADGRARIDAARALAGTVSQSVAGRFRTELWTFGSALERAPGEVPGAGAPRSELMQSVRELRQRYREQPLAAIVLISDGGDTATEDASAANDAGALPIYALGVGSPTSSLDREVVDVTAGETALADSAVDLTVMASSGGSVEPFDVRVLENGRAIDVRRVMPASDGSPVQVPFTVFPPRDVPAVYTAEIPSVAGEMVIENNRRSVLVEPPGRARRLLIAEGAPGFDHTFLKRALSEDAGIELDSVVRKGQDAAGNPTYFVQAHPDRAPRLATGFPADKATLFQYDALVLANIDRDALTAPQLDAISQFVATRGGGILVLGARSFAPDGIVASSLDETLPAGLSDQTAGVVTASPSGGMPFRLQVTADGIVHPVMRIGASEDETSKRWSALPAVSGAAVLGGLRPGAQALALVQAPDGMRPLVAIQRFGRGRSMVFTGEASWRWRMQMPSDDRTYELFWRHAVRWLSTAAPDHVQVLPFGNISPGTIGTVAVEIRDASFAPIADATATARVTLPGGETRDLPLALTDAATGRYTGQFRFDEAGIHRVGVEARRGSASLGSAQRWALVGGADREMADPRLNEEVLRRVAAATGGQYFPANAVDRLTAALPESQSQTPPPQLEDLWHNGWVFAAVVLLLSGEWMMRRRWGLR